MTRVKAPSGHVLTVADDAADFWVGVGYQLVQDTPAKPKPESEAPSRRRKTKAEKADEK